MGLETGTYISDLVATNPLGADAKSSGDDHIRLIKGALKTTFPNVAGAVNPTHVELNYMVGVTGLVQTQLNTLTAAKGAVAGQVWTGAHNFTGANITVATQTPGNNSTSAASTAYVDSTAFAAALPAQTGNDGLEISTNGTSASWGLTIPGALGILNYFGY